MAMEKVTFGDNLPGYDFGPKSGPAVIVIQVLSTAVDKSQLQGLHDTGRAKFNHWLDFGVQCPNPNS